MSLKLPRALEAVTTASGAPFSRVWYDWALYIDGQVQALAPPPGGGSAAAFTFVGPNKVLGSTAPGPGVELDFSPAMQGLADDTSYPQMRVTLGLAIGVDVQAYDAGLQSLAGLATTGIIVQSAANTFVTRTNVAPAAGLTIADPAGIAGDPTFALANDLAALEGLGSTGFAARTAADTWAQRTLQAPAAGFTITNPAGVAGDPTFALANDLAAYEGLASTGMVARTADGAAAARTITGTASQITVTNGDGVAGNPTLAFAIPIASGTYTPTLTGVTNVAASTAYAAQWLRVGATVTVSGKLDIDPTLAVATELGISLPIASAFAAEQECAGTGAAPASVEPWAIRADTTNDRAALVGIAVDIANHAVFYQFTYQAI